MDPISIRIGHGTTDWIALNVLRRSHPEAMDRWDGNWLKTEVLLSTAGFSASVTGDLRVDELSDFRTELEQLDAGVLSEVTFLSMDSWLSLTVHRVDLDHLRLSGELSDPSTKTLAPGRSTRNTTAIRQVRDRPAGHPHTATRTSRQRLGLRTAQAHRRDTNTR
jgi:hypothetical protein